MQYTKTTPRNRFSPFNLANIPTFERIPRQGYEDQVHSDVAGERVDWDSPYNWQQGATYQNYKDMLSFDPTVSLQQIYPTNTASLIG